MFFAIVVLPWKSLPLSSQKDFHLGISTAIFSFLFESVQVWGSFKGNFYVRHKEMTNYSSHMDEWLH